MPIRNYLPNSLTLFIEPICEQHEIPSGGEAIITLEDGQPHSLDYHPEDWISLWDEGRNLRAVVEVYPDQDFKRV